MDANEHYSPNIISEYDPHAEEIDLFFRMKLINYKQNKLIIKKKPVMTKY